MDKTPIKSFSQFVLSESYVNAFDEETKNMYKDQVWNMLKKAYAPIGGIKGSGFNNSDDMVKNIPFWKMDVYNEKVSAVVLYKDKGGRKSVACATDGSDRGKKKIIDMFKSDITMKRSYGEKSKAALASVLKQFPEDVLMPYLVHPDRVQDIMKDDEIIPISSITDQSMISDDGKLSLSKFPFIFDFAYMRKIGNDYVFKVMIGTPGKHIV